MKATINRLSVGFTKPVLYDLSYGECFEHDNDLCILVNPYPMINNDNEVTAVNLASGKLLTLSKYLEVSPLTSLDIEYRLQGF